MAYQEIIKTSKEQNKIQDPAGDISKETGYTSSMKEIDVNNKDCFCKKVELKTKESVEVKHYIKQGLDGEFFDPWGLFSEGTQDKFERYKGKSFWQFKQVSDSCFHFYSKYLQTRASSWFKHAKRENE
jgi:hypothetical protein